MDSGRVCYGVEDTLKALELGAAEVLIVYENLEITRWTLKSSAGSEVIIHTSKEQEADREQFMDKETGQELEVQDSGPLLEWLAEKYKDFVSSINRDQFYLPITKTSNTGSVSGVCFRSL